MLMLTNRVLRTWVAGALALALAGCSEINALISGVSVEVGSPEGAERVRLELYQDGALYAQKEVAPGASTSLEVPSGASTLLVRALAQGVPLFGQAFDEVKAGRRYRVDFDATNRLQGRAAVRFVGAPAGLEAFVYVYVDVPAGYPALEDPAAPEVEGFTAVDVHDFAALSSVRFPTAPRLRLVVAERSGEKRSWVRTYAYSPAWLGPDAGLTFVF